MPPAWEICLWRFACLHAAWRYSGPPLVNSREGPPPWMVRSLICSITPFSYVKRSLLNMIEASDHSWSNTQAPIHGREGGRKVKQEQKRNIHSHKQIQKYEGFLNPTIPTFKSIRRLKKVIQKSKKDPNHSSWGNTWEIPRRTISTTFPAKAMANS